MVDAVVKKKHLAGRLLATVACAFALVSPGPAAAHPEVTPQFVNRYLSVMVLGDDLQYFVTFLFGALPAVDERKRLDRDGDGQIAPAELDAATAAWKARAAELVRFSVDGQPLSLAAAKASVQLGAEQGVAGAPLVVEVYGTQPLAPGPHQLRVEPLWDPPRLGETELSLDLSPDWTLVSSSQGHGPAGASRLFRLEGPRPSASADRSATFSIAPAAAPRGNSRLMLVAAIVAGLSGIALALELRRRQRRLR
jgi:hypothetical protein